MKRNSCGSDYGYNVHRKHKEEACKKCLQAHADSVRKFNRRISKAKQILVENHHVEYRSILHGLAIAGD